MSHFFVVVLVPSSTEPADIEQKVSELLAPYDENLEVEPYERTFHDGMVEMSTYNPKSKWDWWSFGGRWNGKICNAYRGDESGFNFPDEYRQLAENIIPVKALDHEVKPWCIVTPDGAWHEKGKMGWWGMAQDEKEEEDWDSEIVKLFQKYQDCYAVGIDAHI